MCFKNLFGKPRKINKVHPAIKYQGGIIDDYDYDKIQCQGCKKSFLLDQIKINCAGCDRFFHCCIAGKCIGVKCRDQKTILGVKHQLSWCIHCVPGIPSNKVGGKECICHECYQASN